MKRLMFIMAGTVLMFNLSSCAGDEKINLDPEKFVASTWTKTFSDTFALEKADAENVFDTIEWTPTEFGYDAIISYAVQLAVKQDGVNDDDLNFSTLGVTHENKYAVKVKDINAALLAAGAVKRRPTDFVMRIQASVSKSYQSLTSENTVFNATTFSNDPDLLYVIGDYNNFSTDGAEVLFSPGWNGIYDGYVYLSKLDQGIKLVEEIAPETEWGLPASFTPAKEISIQAGGTMIAPGSFIPGALGEEVFDGPGFYHLIVEIPAKKLKLYKFYKEFFVAGQRNMNYDQWKNSMSNQNPQSADGKGTGAVLTYMPAEKMWIAKHVYVPEFQTDAAGTQLASVFEFKFRANHGSGWGNAANLGGANNKIEEGVQSGNVSGTSNIKFLGKGGYYDFQVYLQEYPYRYKLIPSAD